MSDGLFAEDDMFSARLVPWHHKGNTVDIPFATSRQVNELAGIDKITFSYAPIATPSGGEWPQNRFVVNNLTGEPVAVVGKGHQLIQPQRFPELMDELVQSKDGKYVTAGSLFHQTRFFWNMEIDGFEVCGDPVEKIVMNLLGVTSVDESLRAGFYVSGTRTVCWNTMQMAIGSAKRSYATKHTKNVEQRLVAARDLLGLTKAYRDVLSQVADLLANTPFGEDSLDRMFNDIEDTSHRTSDGELKQGNALTRAENRRTDYLTVLRQRSDLARIKDNAWGVLQAGIEVNDHMGVYKTTATSDKWDNRFANIFGLGGTPTFKDRVFSAIDNQVHVVDKLGLNKKSA